MILICVVILLIYRRRIDREPNLLKRGFYLFRLNLILLGVFTGFIALLVFPLSPSLGSFGYPDTAEDVQSAEQILEYLQLYNQALVTSLNALTWFFYLFAIWFLTALYSFAVLIKDALLARPTRQP
ncbi:MAG: hypothetical protein AAF289_13950 [Cyanobacteria bacterium P01_A01_bin.135]